MGTTLNPALQAILNSLNEASSNSSESFTTNHPSPPDIPGLALLPATKPSQHTQPILPSPQPNSKTTAPTLATTPVPDASGITTWPAALKHVIKYLAQNEGVSSKFRRLVSEQHQHEKQWWANREAIIKKHQSRGDTQQQAADLLKSLGGIPTTLRPINESSERIELEAYDKKVYGEVLKMTAAFDRQLRAMGVPFFAIKHELVILEKGAEVTTTKGRLDRGELRELQRRMLQHLEDLFLEDK